ncbi:hypothetical protein TWF481_011971 [Arthrobotrys musiformis]|uniref:Nucleoside phosphorylase domain-containing protein n=1 Tax=Arthrobotrys musiformis TaxID=47236 RepID=A0AAV9W1R9_9PEZI
MPVGASGKERQLFLDVLEKVFTFWKTRRTGRRNHEIKKEKNDRELLWEKEEAQFEESGDETEEEEEEEEEAQFEESGDETKEEVVEPKIEKFIQSGQKAEKFNPSRLSRTRPPSRLNWEIHLEEETKKVKGEDKEETKRRHNDEATGEATDPECASVNRYNFRKVQNTLTGIYEHPIALDLDDALTVYSDAPSVASTEEELFIADLVDELFHKVCLDGQPDNETSEAISGAVPELLKAFALKVGYNSSSQMHRDIMFLIHKNRGKVAKHFRERCSHEGASALSSARDSNNNMAWREKMAFWYERTEYSPLAEEHAIGDIIQEEPKNEEEQGFDHPKEVYRNFLSKAPAFEWLVGSLRREILLNPTEPNSMETIQKAIIKSLPSSRKISKTRSAEAFSVVFMTNWNPLKFVVEQEYEDNPNDAIEKAITLTGSIEDAQALTCAQYIRQAWPSTGKFIMKLIKDVVDNWQGAPHTCILPDDTRITGSLQAGSSELLVWALGTEYSVAEIGQQVAWLGTALRSSSSEVGVVAWTPSITTIQTPDRQQVEFAEFSLHSQNLEHTACVTVCERDGCTVPKSPTVFYQLGFTTERRAPQESPILSNGKCWHNMFRNPIVVKGYPIPRRPNLDSGWPHEASTGLEIPLNMMAGLAQTRHVQVFNEMLFIKGFSTLLVPTKKGGDIIIWHLICNHDGDRISYLEKNVSYAEGLSIPELQGARHVVGWCSKSDYYAGAEAANYDIKPSQLPRSHSSLEPVRIIRGPMVTGGPQFAIGNKDTPLRISRKGKGYVNELKWIHRKFFILWDEEDKRGWLINGSSALLHLVRRSLNYESTDEFSSEFCFEEGCIKEPIEKHKASSAIKVFLSEDNMKQKIYPKGEEDFFRVKDRVEELYDILEQTIDHQIFITERGFMNPKLRARKYLEGWDFNDLATLQDPIYPRVATLQTIGKGWVDFTRSINAVTLFGRGFGEIIKPTDASTCAYWAKLPEGNYFLAADVCDLRNIMGMSKGQEMGLMPMQLINDFICHAPQAAFEQCKCADKGEEEHSNLVQVLLPAKFRTILPENTSVRWPNNEGAVIFGHNASFKWFWRDTGDPEEGEPASPDEGFRTPPWDSGIGSSLNFESEDYTIGIMCALQKELLAVRALFDSKHENILVPKQDTNHYVLGCIGQHNVVATCLPSGEYGTNAAAHTISHMIRSFTNLQLCCLVGIGAGVPSTENKIRLGDVVISHPIGIHPGVIQYDLGQALKGKFKRTGSLQRPPTFVLTAISCLRSDPNLSSQPLQKYIEDIIKENPEYKFPGRQHDKLLATECLDDPNHKTCENQSENHINIHYGLIASGNQVIKDAGFRDRLSANYKVLCIEMEAAGVMNGFPCLVVRGICDYADSEKNDLWQEYASATAAAYVKLLLSVVREADGNGSERIFPRKRAALQHWDTPTELHKKLRRKSDASSLISTATESQNCATTISPLADS